MGGARRYNSTTVLLVLLLTAAAITPLLLLARYQHDIPGTLHAEVISDHLDAHRNKVGAGVSDKIRGRIQNLYDTRDALLRDNNRGGGGDMVLYLAAGLCYYHGDKVRSQRYNRHGVEAAVQFPEDCLHRDTWFIAHPTGGELPRAPRECSVWTFHREEYTVTFRFIPPTSWRGLYNEPAHCRGGLGSVLPGERLRRDDAASPPHPDLVHRWVFDWVEGSATPWLAGGKLWTQAHPMFNIQDIKKCHVHSGSCNRKLGRWVHVPPGCHLAHAWLLRNLTVILDRHRVEWAVAWGSALGALRTHMTIPFDYDHDIIVNLRDRFKFVKAVRELQGQEGGSWMGEAIVRRGWDEETSGDMVPSIQLWGKFIEFWFYTLPGETKGVVPGGGSGCPEAVSASAFEYEGYRWTGASEMDRPENMPDYLPLKRIQLEGMMVPVSANIEEHMVLEYGKTWKRPTPCPQDSDVG